MKEFRAYISENRTFIFTVLLVGLADYFFLGGALKERITRLLSTSLENAEKALGKDLNGDGTIG